MILPNTDPLSTRTQQLASWIDIADETDRTYCIAEAMASMFYLPADTLGAQDYKVSAIRVVDSISFARIYDRLCEAGFSTHLDCSLQLIARAKLLGISLRQNRKTGARHAVIKLWCARTVNTDEFISRNTHSVLNFIATDFSKPRNQESHVASTPLQAT